MLKKSRRLTKRQFGEFFRNGARFHSPFCQLVYSKSKGFHGAVVVGKKVFKRAVDRNRLRRRVYNILYRLLKDGGQGGVYIVITKPSAASASFTELKKDLEKLFNTINPKP